MTHWPKNPIIYEVNSWVWLYELTRKYRRTITLGTVPAKEWDAIASLGVHAVWLMGVWERSPAGRRIALEHSGLQLEYRQALPDVLPEDVVGSPYCIHRYVVDEQLGGPKGLATARKRLATRCLRLVLDFVPNHVAPDHPWVFEHPEYFIRGDKKDTERAERLARQPELPERRRLVLGQERRALPRRRQFRAGCRPRACPGAVG